MEGQTPQQITEAGLDSWYSSLTDPDKVRLKRYLDCDTSSAEKFLLGVMDRAEEDHNYRLAVTAGAYALTLDLEPLKAFKVREAYIDGLAGAGMNEEAKAQCAENLELFPSIREAFLAENGGELPTKIVCRNRLIDIVVGVDHDYETADKALDQFVAIGIMNEDELKYRKQSLKIHRMQRTFDNIFMIPKERSLPGDILPGDHGDDVYPRFLVGVDRQHRIDGRLEMLFPNGEFYAELIGGLYLAHFPEERMGPPLGYPGALGWPV